MSRVRLGIALAAVVMGVVLAGCSAMPSMPDWAPGWMSSKPPEAQLQSLRFESDPPGADVRTAQGQTCLTPCAIDVPSESQPVTISKVGYIPQTVQITTGDPPEHSFWESPPPSLVPNPVHVELQIVPPPPRPFHRRRPRRPVAKTAAKTMPAHRTTLRGSSPSAGQPSSSPFPPPPSIEQPAGSPFPPPPATQ